MKFLGNFFDSTTGRSPIITKAYDKISPEFQSRPISASNIGELVSIENNALLTSKDIKTSADRIALAAIPFRGVVAHGFFQQVSLGRGPIIKKVVAGDEYATEAWLAIVGQ